HLGAAQANKIGGRRAGGSVDPEPDPAAVPVVGGREAALGIAVGTELVGASRLVGLALVRVDRAVGVAGRAVARDLDLLAQEVMALLAGTPGAVARLLLGRRALASPRGLRLLVARRC